MTYILVYVGFLILLINLYFPTPSVFLPTVNLTHCYLLKLPISLIKLLPILLIHMDESTFSWLVCTCSVALSVRLQSKRWVSGSLRVNHERSREAAEVMHACLHLFPLPWLLSPQVSVKWSLLQYCSSHISPDGALDLARENRGEMLDLFNALFPLLLNALFRRVCCCPWGTMVCHYWSTSITWCF